MKCHFFFHMRGIDLWCSYSKLVKSLTTQTPTQVSVINNTPTQLVLSHIELLEEEALPEYGCLPSKQADNRDH